MPPTNDLLLLAAVPPGGSAVANNERGKIYDGMRDAFQPEQAPPGFEETYRFEVKGDEAGEGADFNIDVRSGQAFFSEGEPTARPKLTFVMERSTFDSLRQGELSGMGGFVSGKVKIEGVGFINVVSRVGDLRRFDALFPTGHAD